MNEIENLSEIEKLIGKKWLFSDLIWLENFKDTEISWRLVIFEFFKKQIEKKNI